MALDITDADVYAGVYGFLRLIVPNAPWTCGAKTYPAAPILRGQQNRVPMPDVPCVLMTTVGTPHRIGTNTDSVEAVIVDGELVGFTAAVEAEQIVRHLLPVGRIARMLRSSAGVMGTSIR